MYNVLIMILLGIIIFALLFGLDAIIMYLKRIERILTYWIPEDKLIKLMEFESKESQKKYGKNK